MKCKKCNLENEPNAKFCQNCGSKLVKKSFDVNKFVHSHKKSLLVIGGILCLMLIGIVSYNNYNWDYHHDFTVQNPDTEKYTSKAIDKGYSVSIKPYRNVDGKKVNSIALYPQMDAEVLGKTSKDLDSLLDEAMIGSILYYKTQETILGEPAAVGNFTTRDVTFKEVEPTTVGEEKQTVMVPNENRPLIKHLVIIFKRNDKVYKFTLSSLEKDYAKVCPDFVSFVTSFQLKN